MAINVYICLCLASCLTPAITLGGHLVGGYSNIETNRTDVREAADIAVMKYNEATNDVNLYRSIKIVSAQSQVVAGTNYKLEMEIGRTSCRKNRAGDSCDVANSEVSQVFKCTFVVFESLPLRGKPQHYILREHNCTPL